jgi:hypothetical protein
LQGGIGHLSRLRGLSSDAVVGAVVVSVADGKVMHIGCVPSQHRPRGSVRPDNHDGMLWMLKGAGTHLGVVISVTFQACEAPMYAYRSSSFSTNALLVSCRNIAPLMRIFSAKMIS